MTAHFLTMLTFLAALMLGACNTVEGAGEDVEAAGDAIDNTAEENTPY